MSVMSETTITNELVVDEATRKVANVNSEYNYWTSPEKNQI